jgi:hypothetical protein
VGPYALFGGGCTTAGYDDTTNRLDIYDSTTGLWTTDSLSVPRSSLAATTVGNMAFFAGGRWSHNNPVFSTVDIYTFPQLASAVPEPVTLALMALGAMALVVRRKQ